ncbi:MAG: YjbQ family protein [Polyangiaceae bacterium]
MRRDDARQRDAHHRRGVRERRRAGAPSRHFGSGSSTSRRRGPDYLHHRTGEDNGDAHLKSLLIHHEVVVPVTQGRLDPGPWQQIFTPSSTGSATSESS